NLDSHVADVGPSRGVEIARGVLPGDVEHIEAVLRGESPNLGVSDHAGRLIDDDLVRLVGVHVLLRSGARCAGKGPGRQNNRDHKGQGPNMPVCPSGATELPVLTRKRSLHGTTSVVCNVPAGTIWIVGSQTPTDVPTRVPGPVRSWAFDWCGNRVPLAP